MDEVVPPSTGLRSEILVEVKGGSLKVDDVEIDFQAVAFRYNSGGN